VSYNVVCISHATGAGGEEVGRRVAERLGFQYADEEIVAQAAATGGIGAGAVADEERRQSRVARVFEALALSGSEAWALGGAPGPFVGEDGLTAEDVRALIRESIQQTAASGNVVIVAHAASHALGPGSGALRVLVTASSDTRARRLGYADALDEKGANKAVSDADAGRRDYLRRFYGIDQESPTQYDLVVNTDVLSVDEAAQLVAQAASV
jgi:cytidylate kinase